MISYKQFPVLIRSQSCPFYALLFSSVSYLSETDHSCPLLERAASLSHCSSATLSGVTDISTFVSAEEALGASFSSWAAEGLKPKERGVVRERLLSFRGAELRGRVSTRACVCLPHIVHIWASSALLSISPHCLVHFPDQTLNWDLNTHLAGAFTNLI